MARKATIPTKSEQAVNVLPIGRDQFTAYIVGESGLIQHAMSLKAKQSLLVPPARATTDADRAARGAKHDVLAEFRDSINKDMRSDSPTYLCMPSTAIKSALASAALDMPGSKKAEIGRLCWVDGDKMPTWGKPYLLMSVVRMQDIARTPDVRTRAIIPRWAAKVTISFVTPKLNLQSVYNLLAGAGIIRGVGDWRQEKGSGDYGRWRMCEPDDPEFLEIVAEGGRAAQIEGMENPVCYDADTTELFTWYQALPKDSRTSGGRRRSANGDGEAGIVP